MKAKTNLIAGLDEVGMGCLAGPVVVCVAAFTEDKVRMAGVKDSKTTTAQNRKALIERISAEAAYLKFGYASHEIINRKGIAAAWQIAASMALENSPAFKLLIVDGVRSVKNYQGNQRVTPKADVLYWQVSAASIAAKVVRDSHMECLAMFYPAYDWEHNAGYGTPKHLNGLKEFGPSTFHRTKFIRKLIYHPSL